MSLFHRRSRSQSATRPQTPASQNAHLAAAQAFLANRASQANLSASAAAAAIRTMTPAPVPVEQVQTKRMIQRQQSLSALQGPPGPGRGRGGLQRTSSSGSMTERTFRTPSPGGSPARPVSRGGPQQPPPVPQIPQGYDNIPPIPKKFKQRSASQQAPPARGASPTLPRQPARPQSLDRVPSGPSTAAPASTQTLPQLPELEHTDSRNSVNFSRPLSPRPLSPQAQSPVAQSPATVNGVTSDTEALASTISTAQAESIQHGLVEAANQPVKRKKKKKAAPMAEGSHLHTGTMASKPIVTPLEPGPEPQARLQSHPQEAPPAKKKKKKPAVTGQSSHFATASDTSSRTDSDSDSNLERQKERRAQRASGVLNKRPSIVKEDWEGEQEAHAHSLDPGYQSELGSSPVASPMIAAQSKPQVTANSSRKIEELLQPPQPVSPPATTTPQPEYHAVTTTEPPTMPQPPATTHHLQPSEAQQTRGSSLSPSRSTRFSDRLSSDLAAGRKHEPPPRSVSPAKPALKHHTQLSPSDHNSHARGSSVTPSESSDVSADGAPRRKKSARVSFQPEPEVVGTASGDVESPGSERRSWLGLGKSKPALGMLPASDNMDDILKPRPQLPSFGSVRARGKDAVESPVSRQAVLPAQEQTQHAPSSSSSDSSSSSNLATVSTSVSSDHAVGAILAQEDARRKAEASQRSNLPIPPEVTSVQHAVSFSDSESEESEAEPPIAPAPAPAPPPAKTELAPEKLSSPAAKQPLVLQPAAPIIEPTLPQTSSLEPLDVPTLAVHPPTPAMEQPSSVADQYGVEVPGGFPLGMETISQPDQPNENAKLAQALPGAAPVGLGLGRDNDSDSDDGDSIYSDAAQDPSEYNGDGFGSIDAIVETPIMSGPPPPLLRRNEPPESPLARMSKPEEEAASPPEVLASWDDTQARWNNIAETTRHPPQPEPAVQQQPVAPVASAAQAAQPVQPKPKKKVDAAALAAAATAPVAALSTTQPDSPRRPKNQSSSYPVVGSQPSPSSSAQGGPGPMRQSMRGPPPPAVSQAPGSMKKSMRPQQQTPAEAAAAQGFRKSMRDASNGTLPLPNQPRQRASMPPSYTAPEPQIPAPPPPRAALQKKYIPASTAPVPSTRAPALPPVNNDSDSESSFRKQRRSKAAAGGRYTMRRSMRGGPADGSQPGLGFQDGRNGMSASPTGRRPISPPSGQQRTMRTSMRGSVDVPTLRNRAPVEETRRSSSLFGRRPKSPPTATKVTSTFKKTVRSRIADSDEDDDDAPRPTYFRSRFADDSDDEPEPVTFSPVRGIPRHAHDDDSTDLEDSSDDEMPRSKPQPRVPALNTTTAAQAIGSPPHSPASEKRKGLFGRFRNKKNKDETLSPLVEAPQDTTPIAGTRKPSQLGFASAEERDAIIKETMAKLEAERESLRPTSPTGGHNKLQRRQQPQRVMSDGHWPLPPKMPAAMEDRPATADGPVHNGTAMATTMRTQEPVAVSRTGKKKRFPMLRKAFGLKD